MALDISVEIKEITCFRSPSVAACQVPLIGDRRSSVRCTRHDLRVNVFTILSTRFTKNFGLLFWASLGLTRRVWASLGADSLIGGYSLILALLAHQPSLAPTDPGLAAIHGVITYVLIPSRIVGKPIISGVYYHPLSISSLTRVLTLGNRPNTGHTLHTCTTDPTISWLLHTSYRRLGAKIGCRRRPMRTVLELILNIPPQFGALGQISLAFIYPC